MKIFKLNILRTILGLLTVFTCSVNGQVKTNYVKIGETIPNFLLTDLANYPKESISLDEFRGKWLIIDFWAYSCTSCVGSFPKMDALHKEFGDKAQFLYIATLESKKNDPTGKTEKYNKELFRKKTEKYKMTIPTAFDSILWKKMDIGSLPHILIVDPNGIIRYKTTYLPKEQLMKLLAGGNPKLDQAYCESEIPEFISYQEELPLLTSGKPANGGMDTTYLFRSILTEYNESMPVGQTIRLLMPSNKNGANAIKNGRLELFKYSPNLLYKMAFFGSASWTFDNTDKDLYENFSKDLILNIRDSSLFDPQSTVRYSYSLTVPKEKSDAQFLMLCMQKDLENYFGYKAVRKRKSVPVYYLEVADSVTLGKLKNKEKGDSGIVSSDYQRWRYQNVSIGEFLKTMTPKFKLDLPLFNLVHLNYKIDIDFRADFMDELDVRAKLKTYGLKISSGYKEMEVIEISDAQGIPNNIQK